ncbi:MAG: DUF1579 domain-containing protein [Planctomycetota bacterium]
MKLKVWICSGLFLVLATASATALVAQDKKSLKDDPMMAKWMEMSTPGAQHKILEPLVGKWTYTCKTNMPGMPAEETTGTCETKWTMDGRFIQDDVKGTMMGQPFHGMGFTGYDNVKKKFVNTWIDNGNTGIMTGEGTYDAATKTFTYTGECPDMMTGKYTKSRSTIKNTDTGWTMQAFKTGTDGKETMMMEIQATRTK